MLISAANISGTEPPGCGCGKGGGFRVLLGLPHIVPEVKGAPKVADRGAPTIIGEAVSHGGTKVYTSAELNAHDGISDGDGGKDI